MKISVAMCTYNGERFLREQIDSIITQTLSVDEIIVCDDGSTDNTVKILGDYVKKHPGLFFIYQNKENLRSVKNFEKAITLCTGDLIFLSDQDDRWASNKVKDFTDFFRENPEIQVVASNGYCMNDQSEVLEKYTIWDGPKFLREKAISFNYYKLISYISNIATGATMAIRREILPEILPFPVVKNFHHDEWIAIVASRKNTFEMLDNKYLYYRIHESQQVGGISFDKTKRVKNKIRNVFDFENRNLSYKSYKRRLANLADSYKKNKRLYKNANRYNERFKENFENIELIYNQTRKLMQKKYFFTSIILNFSDKILGKRQLF